jgi:hypothetical protein
VRDWMTSRADADEPGLNATAPAQVRCYEMLQIMRYGLVGTLISPLTIFALYSSMPAVRSSTIELDVE